MLGGKENPNACEIRASLVRHSARMFAERSKNWLRNAPREFQRYFSFENTTAAYPVFAAS